jgi:hypothetical protein
MDWGEWSLTMLLVAAVIPGMARAFVSDGEAAEHAQQPGKSGPCHRY